MGKRQVEQQHRFQYRDQKYIHKVPKTRNSPHQNTQYLLAFQYVKEN